MALSPLVCCLCGESDETGDLISIHFSFTSRVWRFFLTSLSFAFVMLVSIWGMFCQWGGGARGMRGKMFPKALL